MAAGQEPGRARTAASETVEQRCARYRRTLKLPVVVTPASRRIVIPVLPGLLGAVTTPASLGQRITLRLKRNGRIGPVIAHPRAGRMTFLTGPSTGYEHNLGPVLLGLNIGIVSTYVVLPSPADEQRRFRRWVWEPTHRHLPGMREVLDIAAAVAP